MKETQHFWPDAVVKTRNAHAKESHQISTSLFSLLNINI